MNEPLDRAYLEWLYSQVSTVKQQSPSRTYWSLLRQLHTKQFVWLVPNDDNRIEDGLAIRYEFLDAETKGYVDVAWVNLECSFLEMLIGLSRRLSFEAEGEPRVWFWHLIETMNLLCSDANYDSQHQREVDETLNRVIWRQYAPDGTGGMFPLRHPEKDQRDVEIWYQLSAYLLELN